MHTEKKRNHTRPLSKYLEEYHNYTATLSDLTWKLAFSGIAIIWVFRVGVQGSDKIPNELIWPLFLFCGSLLFHLLHYILGVLIKYNIYCYYVRRNKKNSDMVSTHDSWAVPIHMCFWVKIALLIVGYIMLGLYVWSVI